MPGGAVPGGAVPGGTVPDGAVPGGAVMEGREGARQCTWKRVPPSCYGVAASSECWIYKADASSQGVPGSPSFS